MHKNNTISLAVAQQQLKSVCPNASLVKLMVVGLAAARSSQWLATLVLVGQFAQDWAKALIQGFGQQYVPVSVGKDDSGPTGRRHLLDVIRNRGRRDEQFPMPTVQPALVFVLHRISDLPHWIKPMLTGGVVPTHTAQLRPPGVILLTGARELALVHGEMPGVEPGERPSPAVLAKLTELSAAGVLEFSEADIHAYLGTLAPLKDCLATLVAHADQPLLDILLEAFDGRGFRAGEALCVVENARTVFPWLHSGSRQGLRNQLSLRLQELAEAPQGDTVVTQMRDKHSKSSVFRVVRVGAEGCGGAKKKRKASKTPRTPPRGTARRGGAS